MTPERKAELRALAKRLDDTEQGLGGDELHEALDALDAAHERIAAMSVTLGTDECMKLGYSAVPPIEMPPPDTDADVAKLFYTFDPHRLRSAYDELVSLCVVGTVLDGDDDHVWHDLAVSNILKHSRLLALADERLKALGVVGGIDGLKEK